ncbi:hypothetical protein KY289_026904 [Solanum tuberosum]|nr:hypothetical protein KY289_026904 [Solanum tuberosum]
MSRYAPEMVANMRSRMSLFVAGLSRLSSKEGRAAMLISDMDILRLMVYVPQVEEEKLRDREQFKSKRAKTRNESGHAPARRNNGEYNGQNSRAKPAQPQDRVAQRKGDFMRECPKNMQGNGTGGGTNRLYVINSRQEQEDSPDLVTGMIQVFDFTVYALLDPGASLSFVTPYIAMNFDVIPEQLSEPFSVPTPVGESILAERVYRDCPISVNHKSTMADLIELDMVDFDVILVRVNDSSVEVPPIQSVLVVKEFPEVFPDDLPGVRPEREIDFGIDLLPDTRSVSIPPYRMAPAELKKLKEQLKVHENNYPTHDLELVAVIFSLKYNAIIFMLFMWKCSPITKVFKRGVVVMNGTESSLVSEVKGKHDQDVLLLELKASVHKKK